MIPRVWSIPHNGRFRIQSLTKGNLYESMHILRTAFFPDEAVAKLCGVHKNPKAIEELVSMSREIAKDGVSTVTIDTVTNKLAGCHINKIWIKNEESIFEKYHKLCQEEESKAYCYFNCEIDKQVNLYEYYNAKCGFESMLIAVLPQYRGFGLHFHYIKSAIDLATTLAKGENVKTPLDDKPLSLEPTPKFISGLRTTPKTSKAKLDLGYEELKVGKYSDHFVHTDNFGTYAIDGLKLRI